MVVYSLKFSKGEERDLAAAKLDKLIYRLRQDAKTNTGVLCSRDPEVIAAKPELTDLIPAHFPGVKRWFLPVAPLMPSDSNGRFSAYTSCLASGAAITPRRLDTNIGTLKVVVSGSIEFRGRSLTAGDQIWLPAGETYDYSAEKLGSVLFTMLPCVAGIENTNDAAGLASAVASGTFVTSRDPSVTAATVSLRQLEQHAETGEGVTHSFFPFAPRMPVTDIEDGRFFAQLARIAPDTKIPAHTHDLEKLADYKLVISGSIFGNGRELTAGDWIWAPAGDSYNFTVGEQGALLIAGWPHN